jgi:hypothetical protein
MKGILKKAVMSAAVVAAVLIGGLVTTIFFPAPLFARSVRHGAFDVHFPNEFKLEGIKHVLEQAYELAARSELHDASLRFPVFFANGTLFNRIEDLQGVGPIARATAGNITIKCEVDLTNNLAFSTRSTVLLSNLLAHEMVHVQQAHRYGLINFSAIKHPPMWKLEGYPEYIARADQLRSAGYRLEDEVKRYLDLAPKSVDSFIEVTTGHWMPLYYYKGRLMVEYLMEIRGMSYDAILNDTRSEDEVFDEMVRWAHR